MLDHEIAGCLLMSPTPSDMNCLTTDARRIVDDLVARAIRRGVPIRPASVLPLALHSILRWEHTVALACLSNLEVDLCWLTGEVDRLLRTMVVTRAPASRRRVIKYARTLHSFIDKARREANGLKDNYIGTEHLLLVVVKGARGEWRFMMDRCYLTYDRVRAEVIEFLGK